MICYCWFCFNFNLIFIGNMITHGLILSFIWFILPLIIIIIHIHYFSFFCVIFHNHLNFFLSCLFFLISYYLDRMTLDNCKTIKDKSSYLRASGLLKLKLNIYFFLNIKMVEIFAWRNLWCQDVYLKNWHTILN